VTGLRRWLPLLALSCVAACQAPAPKPHDELVRDELALIVADPQTPCSLVDRYERRGRLHYRVVCASGQAYRVQVRPDGRVEVKPD